MREYIYGIGTEALQWKTKNNSNERQNDWLEAKATSKEWTAQLSFLLAKVSNLTLV
jgi:hypothetical protein